MKTVSKSACSLHSQLHFFAIRFNVHCFRCSPRLISGLSIGGPFGFVDEDVCRWAFWEIASAIRDAGDYPRVEQLVEWANLVLSGIQRLAENSANDLVSSRYSSCFDECSGMIADAIRKWIDLYFAPDYCI